MSNAIFPKLKGKSWSFTESPTTSTRVAKCVSGREVRLPFYKKPLRKIELKYNGLVSHHDESYSGLTYKSQQALEGFFLAHKGQYDHFLVRRADITGNRYDSHVEGLQLGVGDGTTTSFVFLRELEIAAQQPYLEAVDQVDPIGVTVYLNGVAQASSAYAIAWPNMVTFVTPPAAGTVVSADYSYFFACRFDEDTLEFESIALALWKCNSVKLQTVKL